jgi:sulfate adenylyltransferase
VLFFTGLSGAGKSTLSQLVARQLSDCYQRATTLLDGDEVRQLLSSELGFTRAHRDLNILRIGYVASEVARHGGIAICAPIAPYAQARQQVREMVNRVAAMIEIHVATPLDICEQRDPKGLYAKARAGLIENFTGISDPYERPVNPEITIDTSACTKQQATAQILEYLAMLDLIPPTKEYRRPAVSEHFAEL